MWRAIYAGHAEKPLWESRFGFCLKQLCIQVARSLARRRKRENMQEHPLPDGDEVAGSDFAGSASLEAEVLGRIEAETLIAAIRRLPSRQAEAALLAWVEERPIEADAEDSVKNIMGITERRVYQLLEKARERLLQDPVIRAKKSDV
jgi:DNA-directed RNA polymerase specialized sigma24 family protein